MRLEKLHELLKRAEETLILLEWQDIDPEELDSDETRESIERIISGLDDLADDVITEYDENYFDATKDSEDKINAFYKKNICDLFDALSDKIDLDAYPHYGNLMCLLTIWNIILSVFRHNFANLLGISPAPVEAEKKQEEAAYIECPEELAEIFDKATDVRLMKKHGEQWEWTESASLYGYFIASVSAHCDMRDKHNRIRWKAFSPYIINHTKLLTTARQELSKYQNETQVAPTGSKKVDSLFT